MPDKVKAPYSEWLAKAADDELSTEVILKEGGAPSTACFLSQQVAEKCLKGLLVFCQNSYPRVHDLLELETLLMEVQPKIKDIHEDLELLNRYYIETRYPGNYPEFSLKEAKEALKAAQKVREFVSGCLGEFSPAS